MPNLESDLDVDSEPRTDDAARRRSCRLCVLFPLRNGCVGALARDEAVESTGLLDVETVRRLWRELAGRQRDHGRALWCLVNLTAWHSLFVDPGDFRDHLQA